MHDLKKKKNIVIIFLQGLGVSRVGAATPSRDTVARSYFGKTEPKDSWPIYSAGN